MPMGAHPVALVDRRFVPSRMRTVHGLWRLIAFAAAVLAAGQMPVSRAAAQEPGLQPVFDPVGRFSINFPIGWRVIFPPSGKPAMDCLAPAAPNAMPAEVTVNVTIAPDAVSPKQAAEMVQPTFASQFHDFAIVQEGPVQIGGNPAYYQYFTRRSDKGVPLYQVQAFLTSGRTIFIITGTTLNEPARVQTDLPLFARIIGTFHLINAPP